MSDKSFNPYLYMLNENRVIWIIMGVTIAQVIIANVTGWTWVHLAAILFLASVCLPNKGRAIRFLASPLTKALPVEEVDKRLSGVVQAVLLQCQHLDPERSVTVTVKIKENGAGGNISTEVRTNLISDNFSKDITEMANALLLDGIKDSRAFRTAIIDGWEITEDRRIHMSNHERLTGTSFLSRARDAMARSS